MRSSLNLMAAVALTALLPIGSTQGQEPWSLQRCIEYALEHNIQLQQEALRVAMARNRVQEATFSALPNLNINTNYTTRVEGIGFGATEQEPYIEQSTNFTASSLVTLFGGFQMAHARRQEQLDLMATVSELERLRNSVSLNIAAIYLQILFNEELVQTATRQVELSRQQVERTRLLVAAGSLPQGSLLHMEAQLAHDELVLVNAQNQRDLSYLTLTQFLDLREVEGFSIVRPALDSIAALGVMESPHAIFDLALQTMPQIQGAGHRVLSAERGLRMAQGGRSPRLTLRVNYGSTTPWLRWEDQDPTEDPFWDNMAQNLNVNVRLQLIIPIFNGLQVQNSISNARIGLDHARLAQVDEKNQLFQEIQQAHADALAAHKRYLATGKSLGALTEAFRYAEQKFSLGLLNSFDYIAAKTRLAQAESELLAARYELVFKSKILDFYRGEPLSL